MDSQEKQSMSDLLFEIMAPQLFLETGKRLIEESENPNFVAIVKPAIELVGALAGSDEKDIEQYIRHLMISACLVSADENCARSPIGMAAEAVDKFLNNAKENPYRTYVAASRALMKNAGSYGGLISNTISAVGVEGISRAGLAPPEIVNNYYNAILKREDKSGPSP